MPEQFSKPGKEIITGIPAHLRNPDNTDGPQVAEVPKYNDTFYVEEKLAGGTIVMTPGWREVYTTDKPDEEGNYWTTLKNPDTGAISQVPTAELYNLQDRVGNPVAPREPLPLSPQVPERAEVNSTNKADFIEDAGDVAVSKSIDAVTVAPSSGVHEGQPILSPEATRLELEIAATVAQMDNLKASMSEADRAPAWRFATAVLKYETDNANDKLSAEGKLQAASYRDLYLHLKTLREQQAKA